MEYSVELIAAQAKELLKNPIVWNRLNELETEEQKEQWLAIAAIHSLNKVN